jgi:hypothetical protein
MVFVVDKVVLGQVFSKYFDFPSQASFHQLLHDHHHLSSDAGTIDNTGRSIKLTQFRSTTNNNKKNNNNNNNLNFSWIAGCPE